MKLFCTLALLALPPGVLTAQNINGDFETWVTTTSSASIEQPFGWRFSDLTIGRQSQEARSGQYSVRMWTSNATLRGLMVLGDVAPTYDDRIVDVAGGVPVSGIPTKLEGSYQFAPGAVFSSRDSAIVVVLLKRYDHVQQKTDTLSFVKRKLRPTDPLLPWAYLDVRIPAPRDGLAPDSISIGFATCEGCVCQGQSCCELTLDGLTLRTAAGVSYRVEGGRLVPATVTPNPVSAAAVISFDGDPGGRYTLEIFDPSGRPARTLDVVGARIELGRGELASGAYLFTIRDTDGGAVARGRFVVD